MTGRPSCSDHGRRRRRRVVHTPRSGPENCRWRLVGSGHGRGRHSGVADGGADAGHRPAAPAARLRGAVVRGVAGARGCFHVVVGVHRDDRDAGGADDRVVAAAGVAAGGPRARRRPRRRRDRRRDVHGGVAADAGAGDRAERGPRRQARHRPHPGGPRPDRRRARRRWSVAGAGAGDRRRRPMRSPRRSGRRTGGRPRSTSSASPRPTTLPR